MASDTASATAPRWFNGTDASGLFEIGNGYAVSWGGTGVTIASGAKYNRIGTDGDGLFDEQERNIISGNTGYGVNFQGAGTDYNTVAGNYVGVDITGLETLPNTKNGIHFNPWEGGPRWNRIGTDGSDDPYNDHERNIISANGGDGVKIAGEGIDYNVVAGNYIGTDKTGVAPLGNGGRGVSITSGAQRNLIGTDGDGVSDDDERNVIAANGTEGVKISKADTDFNVVAGNYIGTNASGSLGQGNFRGVFIAEGAPSNVIGTNGDGTADAAERNVISGNSAQGVLISDSGTEQNVVAGNYIGTDVTGAVEIGNGSSAQSWRGGMDILNDARFNRIQWNVISGNANAGVKLANDASHNVLVGNFIGTDASGNLAMGNGRWGVTIEGSSGNRIGTIAAPPTLEYDASLDGDGDGNWQDTVGTVDVNPFTSGGNADPGLDTDFHLTLDAGVTRVTEGSALPGIRGAYRFDGTGGAGESALAYIEGNPSNDSASWEIWFKPTLDYDLDVLFESGGSGDGMSIRYYSVTNEVTFTVDDSSVQRMVRSGIAPIDPSEFNQLLAVYDKDVDETGNDVLRLYINGQLVDDSTGDPTTALNDWSGGNQSGVARVGSGVAQWGNGTPYEGDIASIRFYESAISARDVQTNFSAVAGGGDGANTIAFNGLDGVRVTSNASAGNAIRGNSIYQNGGLGIDLYPNGVTLNDMGDVDVGPNNFQNFPVLSEVDAGANTRVAGSLNSTADTTFTIDVYANTVADPSGYGEGERFLGSFSVVTDGTGNVSFDEVLVAAPSTGGEFITATATDPNGNTSEFSGPDANGNPAIAILPVQIDIKPGSDPNSINLKNNGVIAVAIFTTADFDASGVDVSTVVFADAFAVHSAALEDVDDDGDLDLILHFRTQDTSLLQLYEQLLIDDEDADGVLDSTRQATDVKLEGETVDSALFDGSDEVDLFFSGKALRQFLDELFG